VIGGWARQVCPPHISRSGKRQKTALPHEQKKAETQRANRAVSEPREDPLSRAYAHIRGRQGKRGAALTSSHDSATTALPVIDSFVFQRPSSGTKRTRRQSLVCRKPKRLSTHSARNKCPQVGASAGRPGCQQIERDPRDWIRLVPVVPDVSAKEGRSVFQLLLAESRDDADGLWPDCDCE
jgi:hypothetical protein